jgi:hypothetical protein
MCSVEREFYVNSGVARVETGDEEICSLVEDRGGLDGDEDTVWV